MNDEDTTTPLKTCTKCGLEFPATTEFFFMDRTHLRTDCKECRREKNRAYRAAHLDQERERTRVWHAANLDKHAAYSRVRYAARLDQERERSRAYRAANPEERRECTRAYREAHKEQVSECQRAYREANPEKRAMTIKQWRMANLEKLVAYEHIRRARMWGVEHERFKPSDIFDRDGWTCGICGDPIDRTLKHPHPMSVSLDHIVALCCGGPHTKANVQAAHLTCNSFKGALDWLEAKATG